jgi:hypothetical protein
MRDHIMTSARFPWALSALLVALLAAGPPRLLAAELYIWTDERGITHIEDTPPKVYPGKGAAVQKYDYEREARDGRGPAASPPPAPPETGTPPSDQATAAKTKQAAEQERQRRQAEIERARQDYEAAKEEERVARIRHLNIDTPRTHYLWNQSKEKLEASRKRLEKLEGGLSPEAEGAPNQRRPD